MTKPIVVIKRPWDKLRLRKLRSLVLKGYNDPEIARVMNSSAQAVGKQRRKFGLPSPGNGSVGSRKRQSVIMAWRNKGVPQEIARCKAAMMGWMDVDGPGKARVLDVLLTGPATAREVADALHIKECTVYGHMRALRSHKLISVAGYRHGWTLWRLADGVAKHVTSIDHRYHRRYA